MTNTNLHVASVPEAQRLGDFWARPSRTVQTGQLYWDVYFRDRSVGQLDGLTDHQAMQALRAMCKVEILAAGDSRADIRKALGITGKHT